MRFLLDANLSPRVAGLLRAGGLDADHVRDHGLQAESDDMILTLDSRRAVGPSVVLMRTNGPLAPDQHAALLLANLPVVLGELESGAIVVLGRDRIRVRSLPFLPPIPDQRGG